jgi:hypothetical protein
MDYWMRATRLTRCGSWCCWDVVVVVVAVTLAGAGWLADASSVDDFRYFPNGMCHFSLRLPYIKMLSIIFSVRGMCDVVFPAPPTPPVVINS